MRGRHALTACDLRPYPTEEMLPPTVALVERFRLRRERNGAETGLAWRMRVSRGEGWGGGLVLVICRRRSK